MGRSFIASRLALFVMMALMLAGTARGAWAIKVAVLGINPTTLDLDTQSKLQGTGFFTQVDLINVGKGAPVPTLAQLKAYNGVLVYSDNPFGNTTALGNVLADYSDAGGGVVVATFSFSIDYAPLSGRFRTGGYSPITYGPQSQSTRLTLVKDLPEHPILNGVNSFDGGFDSEVKKEGSYHLMVSLAAGATQVAHWSNNQPLIVTKPQGTKQIVALNFYPPSNDAQDEYGARPELWTSSTDGAKIMGNALLFAIGNVAAVANPDSYSTSEDTVLTVIAPGILNNDSDDNTDKLTAILVDDATYGDLELNADGSFTYTPDDDYNGEDSFTYKANDGTADSNITTVTLTINAVNDAPVASNQNVTIAANTSQCITLSASDIDSPALSYSIVSGPSHGSISGGTSSTRTYTPDANYIGSDSFTFIANDGSDNSNIATVNITVEGPFSVTSGIVIERGLFIAAEPLPGNFGLRKQVQFVTLKNKSGSAITGPIYLVLDNLNRATLTNRSGTTLNTGSSYIQVNVGDDNVFNVNEKVTVQLNFTPTSFGTITYNTRVLAGSGTP